jgi:adenylylsulfate kinase
MDKANSALGRARAAEGGKSSEHIYAHDHPESDRSREGGFTLWFTGLSGAGKSTIAHLVGPELDRRGLVVEYLDGDSVRTHLSKGLGFSKEDRDTNIERIAWVASRLTRQGGAVIAAAISPYEETRRKARELVEEWGGFVEAYVAASVEECARRDVKGLYEKAFAGEIKGFTGVDDPYEIPAAPELVLDTEEHDPGESARLVVEKLEELGLIPAARPPVRDSGPVEGVWGNREVPPTETRTVKA